MNEWQIFLVDLKDKPQTVKIGYHEQILAWRDVLPRRRLALHDATRHGCTEAPDGSGDGALGSRHQRIEVRLLQAKQQKPLATLGERSEGSLAFRSTLE